MKKIISLAVAVLMTLSSCNDKKVYRPSNYPNLSGVGRHLFAIPYSNENGAIKVRVRLNNVAEFKGTWDTGCNIAMKISSLELESLKKNKTVSQRDFKGSIPVTVANGETQYYEVITIKKITFLDDQGQEHTLSDVQAVIDDNANTEILIGLPVMKELGDSHEVSQYDNLIYIK